MISNDDQPLISILMPCYNAMPLLPASIQSLLNQTYQNWECVIVDDGSSDGSGEYLDTLEDKRFRVFHFNKNIGRPAARQRTLDEARGVFIAMLDAGDLYHPQKLALQLQAAREFPNAVLVSSAMCSFGTKTNILRKRGVKSRKLYSYDGIPPCHASSLIVASYAKKVKYNPKLKLGEDCDFLDRVLLGQKYVALPNITYYYSEFDSVSKRKIKQTYRLNYMKQFRHKEYKEGLYSLLQYSIASLVFPFIHIDQILMRRGTELTPNETKDYNTYCRTILRGCN